MYSFIKEAGEFLRKERELAGLTAKDIGMMAGVSEEPIYSFERGERLPNEEILKELDSIFSSNFREVYVKNLGKKIEEARKNKKLSQRALGLICGFHSSSCTSSINNIESGVYVPKSKNIERIANVLGIDFAEDIRIKGVPLKEVLKETKEEEECLPLLEEESNRSEDVTETPEHLNEMEKEDTPEDPDDIVQPEEEAKEEQTVMDEWGKPEEINGDDESTPKTEKYSSITSFSVEPETLKRLKIYAAEKDTSVAAILRRLIDQELGKESFIEEDKGNSGACQKTEEVSFESQPKKEYLRRSEKVLMNHGIEEKEVKMVLQEIGYILFDKELYPEEIV